MLSISTTSAKGLNKHVVNTCTCVQICEALVILIKTSLLSTSSPYSSWIPFICRVIPRYSHMFMIIQLTIVEFIIVKPIIDSQAMEGTSDADPASLNNACIWKEELWFVELVPVSLKNSCGLKRTTMISGTCGGKH